MIFLKIIEFHFVKKYPEKEHLVDDILLHIYIYMFLYMYISISLYDDKNKYCENCEYEFRLESRLERKSYLIVPKKKRKKIKE